MEVLTFRPATARPVQLVVPRRLSGLLVVVAAGGAVVTAWVPGVLSGPAAMNGSARGTALVVLFLGVPALVTGMLLNSAGRRLGFPVWLGALAFLAYQGVLFLFATPFNELFLVYVAMLSTALWSIAVLMPYVDRQRVDPALASPRAVASYLLVIVVLNTLLWLGRIVPATFADRPTELTDGMGVATNPVFVQDLVFWLPAVALVAVWLWQRRVRGVVLAAATLVFWQIEAVCVAVDQSLGHRADPASAVAGSGAVVLFAVLFVVGLVPTWLALRAFLR